MKIHEYQAKELLRTYGIFTAEGVVITDHTQALDAARKIGGEKFVVKAQIHSGGRGKGGGVKVTDAAGITQIAQNMLGMTLITKQTGADGKKVHKVLIDPACSIAKEYYLSITLDNEHASPVIIASGEGGTEIEEVAEKHPDRIIKQLIDPNIGLKDYHARNIAAQIGIKSEQIKAFTQMLKNMYRMFLDKDCSLIEINPLIETGDGAIMPLDAKITFDDNALFRHPDIVAMRDILEEDEKELAASKYDLSYISLSGNIGCMVNGAGLAMATMDIIKACGGEPANFLDVGGSATAEKVAAAFKILLSDKNVKAILVNIFGGIMKCDIIAQGIISAAREMEIKVPIVVRLDGTNVAEGKKLLSESGLNIEPADGLLHAAKLSVLRSGHAIKE